MTVTEDTSHMSVVIHSVQLIAMQIYSQIFLNKTFIQRLRPLTFLTREAHAEHHHTRTWVLG